MIKTNQRFIFNPGGENEGGTNAPKKDEDKKDDAEEITKSKEEEKPSLIDKIKDALQDWSNKDKSDDDFDNTQV